MAIYLDHAATTPVRTEVIKAMSPYFEMHFANASVGYKAARDSRKAIDMARSQVAAAIGKIEEEHSKAEEATRSHRQEMERLRDNYYDR